MILRRNTALQNKISNFRSQSKFQVNLRKQVLLNKYVVFNFQHKFKLLLLWFLVI